MHVCLCAALKHQTFDNNNTAIGSETYCHEWEGFSPGSQYTVSLEIVYNYDILSTGGPTNVTITIPTLPLSQG